MAPTGTRFRLRQASGLDIRPRSAGAGAFVFRRSPPRVFNLDELSWIVLELSPGREESELIEILCSDGDPVNRSRLRNIVQAGVRGLLVQGLLIADSNGKEVKHD